MTDDSVVGYLARGWSVVALHSVVQGVCTCGTPGCPNPGKHPLYKNWQRIPIRDQGVWQHVSARPLPTNVGIATGRSSGVFALDFDPKNVIDSRAVRAVIDALPPTWSQQTGSGGRHWLFLMPADFEPTNSTGRLPKGLDIRGTGGQIVASPSITDKGAYVVLTDVPAAPPPQLLLDLIRPPAYTPRPPTAPGPVTDARGAAYAERAREGLLIDLRNEHATRNEQAYRVACRLHELLNAGWLDYDITYDAYLEACEQASANKIEPFGQTEADRVWQNAAHKTQDKTAELPPSAMGGTILDFPSARTAGTSSTMALDLPFGQPSSSPDAPAPAADLNLPPDFWAARPVLKHLQIAAHARLVSADVLLHSVLVRLSALWPHEVRLDTGVGTAASANLTVAVIGPSGAGKTTGVGLAKEMLGRPGWLSDRDAFADDRPLGSGEGMSEVYMGSRKVRIELPPEDPLTPGPVKTKLENVRMQVRHNALLYADEGEALAKTMERQGATVGVELRRAWSGGTIGQSNGGKDTTRVIEGGRYSMGLLIGFQLNTVQQLLASVEAGTVQRFLFCWALDPSAPRERLPSPGPLRDVWPVSTPLEGSLVGPVPEVDLRPVTFTQAIMDEIWEGRHGRLTTEPETLEDLSSHRALTLVKVSVLLAYLDGGRRAVSDEDWRLAGMVWETSCRVRDHAIRTGRVAAGKASAADMERHAGREGAAEVAKLSARDADDEKKIEQGTLAIGRWVAGHHGTFTRSRMLQCVRGAYRSRLGGDCVTRAIERQWVIETDDGKFDHGPVRVS
jgi:hypothetical protein